MRAIGIVRQSRGSEESLSPAEQRERIAAVCEREGLTLIAIHEEIDVSGGTPLAEREGLRFAVEAVEDRRAEVVVVAYFDRLFRSLTVQAEVVERVERAGGRILAADVGEISGATAGSWISSGVLGLVAEYYRRSVRERSGEAQRMAVADGRIVYADPPPGYRVEGGRLVPDEDAEAIRVAYRMRADGATLKAVRALLRERGIERSHSSINRILANRTYLGEVNFGKLRNPAAHEPIVDRPTWEAVQRMRGTRGSQPASERLLARLGVLRCGTCGSRMVVGMQTQGGRRYPFYRCPPTGDCPRRVTIGAEKVEGLVVRAVKVALADVEGRASAEAEARRLQDAAEDAQDRLDAAIRSLAGMGEEPATVETLRELREARDRAVERAAHLRHRPLVVTVADWDRLLLSERRALVRAVVERVEVRPGRDERVAIHLVR